jgi:hypothetical protein
MTSYMAYDELQRIRKLAAFNVSKEASKKRLNQYAVKYTFPDKSILKLYAGGRGQSWASEGANCDCVSLIRANTFSAM